MKVKSKENAILAQDSGLDLQSQASIGMTGMTSKPVSK